MSDAADTTELWLKISREDATTEALAARYFAALAAAVSVEVPAELPAAKETSADSTDGYGHAPDWRRCTWRVGELSLSVKLETITSSVGVHGEDGTWKARGGELELVGWSSFDARHSTGTARLDVSSIADETRRAACAEAFRTHPHPALSPE